jgi:hypothetical protein
MAARYVYKQKVRNAPIRRRLDRRFLGWVVAGACLGSVLAFGYVYGARCHFTAMDLGYQIQQRREDLERNVERRRILELERARMLAPARVEERARRLGLRAPERPEPADVRQHGAAVERR